MLLDGSGCVFLVQKRRFHRFTQRSRWFYWVHRRGTTSSGTSTPIIKFSGKFFEANIPKLVMLPCKEDISNLQSTCISSQIFMWYNNIYIYIYIIYIIYTLYLVSPPRLLPCKKWCFLSFPTRSARILDFQVLCLFSFGDFFPKKVIQKSIPKLGHRFLSPTHQEWIHEKIPPKSPPKLAEIQFLWSEKNSEKCFLGDEKF